VKIGKTYTLRSDLRVLCCDILLRAGETVVLLDNKTPNRIRVKISNGQIHNVKRSAFGVSVGEVGEVRH